MQRLPKGVSRKRGACTYQYFVSRDIVVVQGRPPRSATWKLESGRFLRDHQNGLVWFDLI